MTKGKSITAITGALTAIAMSVLGYFEFQKQADQLSLQNQPYANYHMSVCIDGYAYYVMTANQVTSMIIRLNEAGEPIGCSAPVPKVIPSSPGAIGEITRGR